MTIQVEALADFGSERFVRHQTQRRRSSILRTVELVGCSVGGCEHIEASRIPPSGETNRTFGGIYSFINLAQ